MKCKNTIAMVLAGAMLLPSNAFAADLSQYRDFPNDWSAKALEQAIDDGLLNGSNGMIDAKGLLTRAQMAAIVSRAFGAAKTASLDDYRDVLPSAWYYSDMGKAVKMGAFQGANGLLNPDAPITREEAFTVLARAFALEGGGSATLKDFVDGGTVSSWASESVAALVAGGYVNGANGMLNLKNNITRAEFAKVITGMAASYVGAEGVSGKTVEGNVIVRESGASLSGMTINGDLIIADSADKVSLDNVKVTGRIVIRGGADAVSIKDTTTGKGVLVSSPNGAAAISVSGGSVGTVTAKSDLSLSGSVSNVAVTDKATLTVEKNASVGTVTVSAAGSKVTGDGKVTNVQANANNVTVTSKGTKVTAGSGVSGVKAGDKAVESGKTETVGTASTSSGGSSGGSHSSGGGGSSTKVTTWADMYKGLGVDTITGYDAVTSATNFASYHAKDIPTIINKNGASLDGVKLTGKTASVTPKLSSASYAYSSKYGTGEFDIVPDATVSGYVWNDYKNNLYAVTISDGTTTVGALPWVDYYGEDATSGYHYNKVQIALNNGTSKASNEAEVSRYKAFYDETGKHLKAGTYTITLYSEGYEPLKAEVEVKADADRTATVTEADFTSGTTGVALSDTLPSDFDAAYSFTVNGETSDFFTYANNAITWDGTATEIPSGTYQLVIHDNSDKYADITAQIKLNVYAFASVPYDEYWKSEGVYLSGKDWAASSDVEDTNREKDKGAFDAVSRATTKHGRHRGSFQQNVVIDTTDSKQYTPVYWINADTAVVSTGEQVTLDKTNIQDYKITGIKYVPVKVSASDFADFCTKYTVTKNGKELKGGYLEDNLKAYSDLVADVDADTNGLKTVTKGRGGYSFGKRQTGTGSGIKNQTLQTADEAIVVTEKTYDSANKYGAHLRVDLTNPQKVKTDENGQPVKDKDGKPVMVDIKNVFGALGDNMQTVVWKYYGDGDTVLATYGTKFAADNWIHSRKGIQLGLTDSLRFQLPEGTDGTGKWTITIYALGYSDTTYTVTMTKDNVAEKVVLMTDEQRTQLTDLAKQAKDLLPNYPDTSTAKEAELKKHYDQAAALLENKDATSAAAAELIGELPGLIQAVKDERDTKPTVETKTITGTISPSDDKDENIDPGYDFSFEVTLKNGTIISISNDKTDAGDNKKYWKWASTDGRTKGSVTYPGLFTSLIGKDKDTVNSVEAVSGATVSSNAIKKAVKAALGAND